MNKPVTKKKRIVFKYYGPAASQVFLAGSFNQWDPGSRPLKKDPKGWWKTSVTLGQSIYQYRFVVDGSWCSDPRSSQECDNGLGTSNSVIVV
jgi:1,4-alpha-glucan branching enzyme